MKTKPDDMLYCGARPKKLLTAKPKLNQRVLELHWKWMSERYSIHVKKDVQKLPAPWTDDKVLREHKFTNLRREDDRQSIWYLENICNRPDLDQYERTLLAIMFRMFNINTFFDFWEGLYNKPIKIEDLVSVDLDQLRAQIEAAGEKPWFTNAFNTGGLKQCLAFPESLEKGPVICLSIQGGSITLTPSEARKQMVDGLLQYAEGFERNMVMRVVRAIKRIHEHQSELIHEINNAPWQSICFDKITQIRGLSYFLGYQIFVDLTYHPDFKFSENEFTVAGPGCKAGLDLLFEDRDGLTHEECLFWLRDNALEVYGPLGYEPESFWVNEEPHDKCFNVMCLENAFCETLKYVRCVDALESGKRPRTKVKYNGSGASVVVKKPTSTAKKLW